MAIRKKNEFHALKGQGVKRLRVSGGFAPLQVGPIFVAPTQKFCPRLNLFNPLNYHLISL